MQPTERDAALLWDMWQAAREVLEFVQGVRFNEFASNKPLRYAVERQIITIGEAARQVSLDFQQAHSDIPWRAIVGQRNILVHDYGEIRIEKIRLVAQDDLPKFVQQLEPLIPPPPTVESDRH